MNTRTDMAHEALQHCPALSGVEEENESKGRMRISRIRIRTQGAERKLDKPRGSYITLTLPEDGLSSKAGGSESISFCYIVSFSSVHSYSFLGEFLMIG